MSFFSRSVNLGTLVISVLASQPSHAILTAVFPNSERARTAVWVDQSRVLNAETAEEKQRFIWVQGGDSLSSAWSNGNSIRSKVAKGDQKEIPAPRTWEDTVEAFPDYRYTWYAGSEFGLGVLGRLDALRLLYAGATEAISKPWVVISTALAGSRLYGTPSSSPSAKGDPLALMTQVSEPDRVRLVTFSLGSNDLCDGNPLQDETDLRTRLRALRQTYPKATFVPFQVIPVKQIYAQITAALNALPDSPGKARTLNYCRQMWQLVCPRAVSAQESELSSTHDSFSGATSKLYNLEEYSSRLDSIYAEELNAEPYNALNVVRDMNILDIISTDCFHPSAKVENRIIQPLADLAAKHLKP